MRETGLLPHINAGVMGLEDILRLKQVGYSSAVLLLWRCCSYGPFLRYTVYSMFIFMFVSTWRSSTHVLAKLRPAGRPPFLLYLLPARARAAPGGTASAQTLCKPAGPRAPGPAPLQQTDARNPPPYRCLPARALCWSASAWS